MGVIKKIFIVSTVLLLLFLVFFGIYILAFKKTDIQDTQKEESDILDIADIVSEKMINITSDPVISATIGPNGDTIRYHDALDGRAWTMTLRGTNKDVLSNETNGVPQDVTWSSDGTAAILAYDNGTVSVYNYATNAQSTLRDGMDDVEWAGMSGKILYKYYDQNSKERSLNIANTDGNGWKKIADLPYRFTDFVQIPSSILAAFWPTAQKDSPSELYTVNTTNTNEPKKIYQGMNGTDYLFSPDGKKILVSVPSADGTSISLGVMDANGKNYNDLTIPTTIKKAVWSSDGKTVYYALPNNVPDDVVWPDDYNQKKFVTQDTFFKLDITTGKQVRIIELKEIQETVDATHLFLSPSEDQLFFINRENNLLYRLSL